MSVELDLPKVTCGVFRMKNGSYGLISWLVDDDDHFVRFVTKDVEKNYNWWTLRRIKDPMFGFFCWKMLKQKDGWDIINRFKPADCST